MSAPTASRSTAGSSTCSAQWPWLPLTDLASAEPNSITDGPFGSKLKTEHYTESGPRVLRLQNIGDTVFVDAKAHISESHFATLQKHRVFPGDVVIAALGERPPRSCIVPDSVGPAIVKADCIRFKTGPKILPKFANYALNSEPIRKQVVVHGVGRPRLNLGEIKSIRLPCPDINEQREVVAEIEKQFTRLDSGVAALRRVQANLKRHRTAVLKAACEGRLVPTEAELARKEGRTFESGEALLTRILTVRREMWQGRGQYKVPAAPDTESLPGLPSGWTWATVEQLAAAEPNSITDGPFGSNLKTAHYTDSGPRVVRLKNIGDGIFLDDEAHISETHFERLQKHRIFAGDVVIAAFGENPPRSCVIPQTLGPAIVKADCIRLKPHRSVMSRYINIALNSDPVRKRTKRMIHGVGRPRLNLGEIRSIAVPLPPFSEQMRIVAEVERRLSVADNLNSTVSAILSHASRLRDSTLQQAFSGVVIYR